VVTVVRCRTPFAGSPVVPIFGPVTVIALLSCDAGGSLRHSKRYCERGGGEERAGHFEILSIVMPFRRRPNAAPANWSDRSRPDVTISRPADESGFRRTLAAIRGKKPRFGCGLILYLFG
jgi:hypothetical protein